MEYQAAWEKVALQIPGTNGDTVITRGQKVPDGVDEFTLQTLASVGALQVVVGETSEGPSEHPPQGPMPAPSPDASKADWVAYAATQGVDEKEANRLSKDALIKRVS